MKKIILYGFVSVVAFSFVSCNSDKNENNRNTGGTENENILKENKPIRDSSRALDSLP